MEPIFNKQDSKQIVIDANMLLAFEIFQKLKSLIGQESVEHLIQLTSQRDSNGIKLFCLEHNLDLKKIVNNSINKISNDLAK